MVEHSIKRSLPRRIFRVFLILLLAIIFLIGATYIYFQLNKDKIYQDIVTQVNQEISGKITIEKIKLSPLSHLPYFTIRLEGIEIYELADTDSAKSTPLAKLQSVYLAFNLFKWLNDIYEIKEISLNQGYINLEVYEDGSLNVVNAISGKAQDIPDAEETEEIDDAEDPQDTIQTLQSFPMTSVDQSPDSSINYSLALEQFNIRNLDLSIVHQKFNRSASFAIESLGTQLNSENYQTEAKIKAAIKVGNAVISGFEYMTNKAIGLDLDVFIDENKGFAQMNESKLRFEDVPISVQGTYDMMNEGMLDMVLEAEDEQFTILAYLLEDEILNNNLDFLQDGSLDISGYVKGPSVNAFPSIVLTVNTNNLQLAIPGTDNEVATLELDAVLDFGDKADLSNAFLKVDTLSGNLPGGSINGSFYLEDFIIPYLDIQADITADLQGYEEVFKIEEINDLSGNLVLTARIKGKLDESDQSIMKNPGFMHLSFDSTGFKLSQWEDHTIVLDGILYEKSNSLFFDKFKIAIDESDLEIDGSIPQYSKLFLINNQENVEAHLELASNTLDLHQLELIDSTVSDQLHRIQNTSMSLSSTLNSVDIASPGSLSSVQLRNLKTSIPEVAVIDATEISYLDSTTFWSLNAEKINFQVLDGNISGEQVLIDLQDNFWDFSFTGHFSDLNTDDFQKISSWINTQDTVSTDNPRRVINANNFVISLSIDTAFSELRSLEIRDSDLIYFHTDTTKFDFGGLDLKLKQTASFGDVDDQIVKGIKNLSAELLVDQVNSRSFKNVSLTSDFEIWQDSLSIMANLADEESDKSDRILFRSNLKDRVPAYSISYSNPSIIIHNVLDKFYDEELLTGTVALELDFYTSGRTTEELIQNSNGLLDLSGSNIILHGIDLDDLLQKFEKTQKFNFADVGAVFLMGPFGAVITKGRDFGQLVGYKVNEDDSTNINRFLSDWKIQNGTLSTSDVGFTTDINRIIVNGSINLNKDSIENVTVAVIDEKGCSLLDQSIYGKYDSIQYGQTRVANKVFGAVINVLKIVTGNNCEVLYEGELEPPEQK